MKASDSGGELRLQQASRRRLGCVAKSAFTMSGQAASARYRGR